MRKLIAMSLILILVLGLTGCGGGKSKEDLERENATMLQMLKDSEDKIATLEATIKALSGSDANDVISSINTGVINEIKGTLVLPVQMEFNGFTEAPGAGKLVIAQNVAISPSNNWVVKVKGSTVELGHQSGIHGIIKIGTIQDMIKPEQIDNDVLKPFYSKLAKGGVTYKNIFAGDTCWGRQVQFSTSIGKDTGIVTAGAVAVNGVAVMYNFVYKGNLDSTKNELIEILLKTMTIGGLEVTFN